MALTPRVRFQVLQRDGFTCRYCGRRPPEVKLHVDHIVPRAKGGSDHHDNLQAACDTCNRGKAARAIEGIERERQYPQVDPMREVCSSAMDLFSLLEMIWRDFDPSPGERDWIKTKMMELYWSVMDYGDLPEEHPWRERLDEVRHNSEEAKRWIAEQEGLHG
jgi:hypothetical protein